MRCVSASATFFAGVKRSSPYRIIECEQSSISTVAQRRAVLGLPHHQVAVVEIHRHRRSSPVRIIEFLSVSLTSMFSTSPNSYGLLQPSASMPVARYGVS